VKANRLRAEQRLHEAVKAFAADIAWCDQHPNEGDAESSWRAYRRALRAWRRKLAVAADAAVIDALTDNGMTPLADIGDAAYAAVLGQGQREKKP
jgi:hypothetical protein